MLRKDGGHAFPTTDANHEYVHGSYGMTLRDYFAAHAIGAACLGLETGDSKKIARRAYSIADAMLDTRSAAGSYLG